MSIDIKTEKLIRLGDVPMLPWLPRRKGDRPLAASTPFRWAQTGIRGIKLEVTPVGGAMCTTEAALLRFFEACRRGDRLVLPGQQDAAAHARAEAMLAAKGL